MNKHIELIKAWADGAQIQRLRKDKGHNCWVNVKNPTWDQNVKYRVKPDVMIKTPDGDFSWRDVKKALLKYFNGEKK